MKVLKEIKRFLKVERLDYTILGLNPKKLLEDLEQSKEGKDKKELKAIESRITNIMFEVNSCVKIIFDFKDKLKQLVYMSGMLPTEHFVAFYDSWTALLDFPISKPLIFGRAHNKPVARKGEYFFAPLDVSLPNEILTSIDQEIEKGKVDQYLYGLASANIMIDLLEKMRYSKEAFDQMKTMLQLIKKKQQTGIHIIDKFNSDKNLTNLMKSVPHFANTMTIIYQHASEVDVSTICMPLKIATLVQIVDFGASHKKTLRALYYLSKVLEEFAIEPVERRWVPSEPERLWRPAPLLNDSEKDGAKPISAFELLEDQGRQSISDSSAPEETVRERNLQLDADPQKRIQTIDRLGKDGSPQAIKILIQILLKDTDSSVRAEAATALGITGDKELIPILRRAMNEDRDPDVRSAVVEAIELIERKSY